MEERKQIMEVLLAGINSTTLSCLKNEINPIVDEIIVIKNSLTTASEEEISLLEEKIKRRNEIVGIRTIEGEPVGLEPRFLDIVGTMIEEKKNATIKRVRF